MSERIGVYICECGPNIKDAVYLDELVSFAEGLDEVVTAKPFRLLCSNEGQEFLANEIRQNSLTRVVIAACSPKEHLFTFKKALESAGLNPFLMQMVNIREQCAWVIKDKSLATEKAKILINAAVRRVRLHEPIEAKEIDCETDVVVVGAGIAGISAALTLAQKNRQVYLVDKSPVIGGKVARYEDVFPNLECATCMLEPSMDEVLHHDNISILTYSEIEQVKGYYGNFSVKVINKSRYVDKQACIGCAACFECCPVSVQNEYNEGLDNRKAVYIPYEGALPNVAVIDQNSCLRFKGEECELCRQNCPFDAINYRDTDKSHELRVGAIVLATGFDLFDPTNAPQYGYKKIADVYTSLEFERILSSTGPTGGEIQKTNGEPPQHIALIYCVGSRCSNYFEHCSAICCTLMAKFALLAKKKLPDVNLTHFYADFCLPGKDSQAFFNRMSEEEGIEFKRMQNPDLVEIGVENEQIVVKYRDECGSMQQISADMAVLAPAITGGSDAKKLAVIFNIKTDANDFFSEEHSKLNPVSSNFKGIYIVGGAHAPCDIQSAVTQGQAASGLILSKLLPGEKLILEGQIAVVDEEICSGCKTCLDLCPYKAIFYDETEKQAFINEALCCGCGICAAACPSSAITARHFTDNQITEEIKGLLNE